MTAERLEGISESNVAGQELLSFIERAKHLNEEIKALNNDKKEIFAEAKGRGFDVAVIKELIKLRASDESVRQEHSAILQLYASAIGLRL